MRSSFRISLTAAVVAVFIIWYFGTIRSAFATQLEHIQDHYATKPTAAHKDVPVVQPLSTTKTEEISTSPIAQVSTADVPGTTQTTETGWPLVHLASDTQQPQHAATESPAASADQHSSESVPDAEQDTTPSQSGLEKGELVMIVATSGSGGYLGVPGLHEKVYENRMAYADRWGHEFMWANMSSYKFSKTQWNKIPIIQDAHVRYPKAKWFWWLDFDAIIVNGSLDIYDHILSPESMMQHVQLDTKIPKIGGGYSGFTTPVAMNPDDIHMLITFDNWGMNVGSFIMRRCEWTDIVLEIWADPLAVKEGWIFPEQDGWVHAYQHHEYVRKHTGVVKQRALNAYPDTNFLGSHWQPGDLVVHFPGCGGAKNMTNCVNNWQRYWDKRDDHPTPEWILKQIADGTAPIEREQPDKP